MYTAILRQSGRGALIAATLLSSVAFGQDVRREKIGEMVLEDVPAWSPALRDRMLQYLNIRSAALLDLGESGAPVLITTRFGDTNQLHIVNERAGMRRQITFFDEPVGSGFFVPGTNCRELVFARDVGGDEKNNYFALDLESGRTRLLTDGESRHGSVAIARDGRRVAFTGTARNGRDFDVYVRDMDADAEPRRLWDVDGAYYVSAFSPAGDKLLVLHYLSARETEWYIVDVASGDHERITPDDPPAYYGGGVWSPNGQAVYLISDREGEFRQLFRYDLARKRWKNLTPDIAWDIDEVAAHPTDDVVAYSVNEDGLSKLYFGDGEGRTRRPITGLPTGIVAGLNFSRDGNTLGFTLESTTAPAEAYTYRYANGPLTRMTFSEVGGLDTDQFVEPTLIRFPTFDQVDGHARTISAFYYRAKGAGPRPVVIYTHGGPEAQFQPSFSSAINFWVNELGISVIAPNVRGSTGYGRTFHQLDNGVKREDSVRDIGALLDWIDRQPELDATRVGIFGGSYGGYMVLGSLVNYPKRIKAGIDIVGIASFVTFLENTPEFRRDLRRAEYGDERDPEVRKVLSAISPLNQADKIEAALFVIHGQNDPRVPVSEAEQIVAKMRSLGRSVWYANALNEGHGFRKKPNRDLAAVLYAHFWQEHLLK